MVLYHACCHRMTKMRSMSGGPSPAEWSLERSSCPDWPELDLDPYRAKVEAEMNLPPLKIAKRVRIACTTAMSTLRPAVWWTNTMPSGKELIPDNFCWRLLFLVQPLSDTTVVLRKYKKFCFSWKCLVSRSHLFSRFRYEFLCRISLLQDLKLIWRFSQHEQNSVHFSRSKFLH